MPNCKECGKWFKAISNTHLLHHKMTMKGYQNKYKGEPIREVDTVNKMYSAERRKVLSETMSKNRRSGKVLPPIVSGERKREASKRMVENNPMKQPEVVSRMQATKQGRVYNLERTEEQKRRYSISKLGDKNPMKNPVNAQKSAQGHNRKKSGVEIRFDMVVEEYGLPLKYVGNNKLWIGHKNPDYVDTEGRKIVIEITSDAYHRLEEGYEEKRIEHFKQHNYRCITIRYTGCNKSALETLHNNLGKLLTKLIYENSSYQVYHTPRGEISCVQH